MSKEVAVDVLNNGIRTLKDLAQPSGKPSQERTYAEMILGVRLLLEALAVTLNDSTKAHGAQAFDKAHKQLFGLTQATSNPGIRRLRLDRRRLQHAGRCLEVALFRQAAAGTVEVTLWPATIVKHVATLSGGIRTAWAMVEGVAQVQRLAWGGLLVAGLASFLLHASARAELTAKQDKSWAGIAGAWWLNDKCRFLDEATKAEFEWTVAQLTSAVSKEVGTKRTLLRIKIAGDVAKRKRCDDSSREIVTQAVGAARDLNRDLGGEDYVAGASDLEYDLERLEAVAVAVGIEERCKFGPQEGRTSFIATYESLLRPMSVAGNDDELPVRMNLVRALSRGNEKQGCTNDTHGLVLSAVGEARSLGAKYRVESLEED